MSIKNNKNILKTDRMLEKINLIFEVFWRKISFKKFWGFRALNIQSFKKLEGFGGAFQLAVIV